MQFRLVCNLMTALVLTFFGSFPAHGSGTQKSPANSSDQQPMHAVSNGGSLNVIAYNVQFGHGGTPEQFAETLRGFAPDIVILSEAPGGDWCNRLAASLRLEHVFVGSISSANHRDKYKAIVSRTPLFETREFELHHSRGWDPASAVRAVTEIDGHKIAIYAVHIAYAGENDGHAWRLAEDVLSQEPTRDVIVGGDFNTRLHQNGMRVISEHGYRAVWNDVDADLRAMTSVPEWKSDGVIDHIMYRDNRSITATAAGIIVSPKPLSDHYPVWSKLRLAF